jgi:AraC family transcriptional regulator, regulatory protein of adaptative response / methylated-DNA-[protein]-cysteine methyltransferase
MSDYDRIASAIAYLQANVTAQPQLADIARHVHLSPFHFQRLFTRWAGTTPKRFLQVLTLELGKNLLTQSPSILAVTDALGLSSSSRLHDHFVQIEAVTPGEFRSKGAALCIEYGVQPTPFGDLFVAQTPRGICRAAFMDADAELTEQLSTLQKTWPLATYIHNNNVAKQAASVIAALPNTTPTAPLSLHINGTNFQLAVWRALLSIPAGTALSYSDIATSIGSPTAVRAVGTAIGANPVALLIPCHRVIQQSGALGGYRWGLTRKVAIQAWERL